MVHTLSEDAPLHCPLRIDPEYKAKMGTGYSNCTMKLLLLLNLVLMLVASVAYIVGQWFGPVSLAVPIVMVSKLLFNMIYVGFVLRMSTFPREQKIGTYCIACAISTLPDLGARDQDCVDAVKLVKAPVAMAWAGVVAVASLICIIGMVVIKCRRSKPTVKVALAVYVTAQATSAVVGASVSKMFALVEGTTLFACFGVAVVFAVLNVVSLIMAAQHVDQAIFIPITTSTTLGTNMVTGLIIWEDWKTITHWVAYFAVYAIMLLSVFLLAPANVLQQYKNTKGLDVAKEVMRNGTLRDIANHQSHLQPQSNDGQMGCVCPPERPLHTPASPSATTVPPATPVSPATPALPALPATRIGDPAAPPVMRRTSHGERHAKRADHR